MERIEAVAVAGGGTGGHLFPGLAVAEEFRRRFGPVRILYIGVRGKLEEEIVPANRMEFHGLTMSGLKGMGRAGQVLSLVRAGGAFLECRRVLADFRPDLLVGVGGYSSGPAGLAAWTLGLPLVLQEQNTVPGLTNRLLGRLAKRVFLAFEEAASFFPAGKAVVTGNPIRREALAEPSEVGRRDELCLLVLGGSRGAAGLNRLVTEAVASLGEEARRLRVVHQSGADDLPWVERSYREAGVEAEVRSFLGGMAERYARADVVVSRAGAGAVAELAANGRPALLVPYPHAAAGHQERNARWLVARGGALMIKEDEAEAVRKLAESLQQFAADREKLREMAAAALSAGRRDAAGRIVSECSRLLGIEGG